MPSFFIPSFESFEPMPDLSMPVVPDFILASVAVPVLVVPG